MKNKFKCIGLILCAIGILAFVSFSLKVLNVQAYTGLSETDEKSLYNETTNDERQRQKTVRFRSRLQIRSVQP